MRGRQELAQEDTVENEEQDPETIRAQEETREGAVRQHLTDTIYVQIYTENINKVYYYRTAPLKENRKSKKKISKKRGPQCLLSLCVRVCVCVSVRGL